MFHRHSPPRLPAPSDSQGIEIQLLQSADDLAALAPRWDALLLASASNSIFQSWRYLSLWWKHFGSASELAVLTAEHDGELLGVAPLQIRWGTSGARKHLRHLCFLGTLAEGEALLCDFPVRPGWEEILIRAFFSERSPLFDLHWDTLYLPFIPADSPCSRALIQAPGPLRQTLRSTPQDESPIVPFPASWDEFLASLSSKFRSNLRAAIRSMEKKLGAEEIRAGEQMSVAEMHQHMAAFTSARWQEKQPAPSSPQFLDFELDLLTTYHQHGALEFYGWRKGDEIISLNCGLVHDNLLWGYQMGWNPAFAKASPGQAAMASMVRHGIERGYRGLNMLLGGGAYKSAWGATAVPLCRLEAVHLRSLRGSLFGAVKRAQENWEAIRHRLQPEGPGERAA